MRTLELPGHHGPLHLPVLGLGTWRMGEKASSRANEVKAIRHAIELGYRLFDTAEMYGDGGAEEVLGIAIAEAIRAGDVSRPELTIVSKVLPQHASRQGTAAACSASRKRLGLDQIDLYLLHWRGSHPLVDTVQALRELTAREAIRAWGVSNFDADDMEELDNLEHVAWHHPNDPPDCVCDQVYMSPTERGPEHSLLPWLQTHGLALMAYSPIDQGAATKHPELQRIAHELGVSAATLSLAWLLSKPSVCVIPKTTKDVHLKQNFAAASLEIPAEALKALEAAFPRPREKTPLAMI